METMQSVRKKMSRSLQAISRWLQLCINIFQRDVSILFSAITFFSPKLVFDNIRLGVRAVYTGPPTVMVTGIALFFGISSNVTSATK